MMGELSWMTEGVPKARHRRGRACACCDRSSAVHMLSERGRGARHQEGRLVTSEQANVGEITLEALALPGAPVPHSNESCS